VSPAARIREQGSGLRIAAGTSLAQPDAASAPLMPQPAAADRIERAVALSAPDVEALLLNLDAAFNVHTRAHFFSWTQGLLQGLIRHEVLICALRGSARASWQVDSFSTRVADGAVFSAPLLEDIALAPRLVDAWQAHHHLPLALHAGRSGVLGASAFALEIERTGAAWLALHGCHDSDGEATSLFMLACPDGGVAARELGLLRLLVPFLHEAWVRSQMTPAAIGRRESLPGLPGHAVITAREQEILKWIYLGKSNAEIGLILGISPLTVKNHVQKVLRKLNVVNRAQAVGKAIEAHLIRV
jgi:transcriptional regulator EpsA